MKNRIFVFLLLSVFLLTWGCHPQFLKRQKPKSEIDSVLFYQKKDVPDPFLDLVLSKPHETIILKKTLVPPPVPPKKFKEVPGYRIQVFAGIDSLNALQQKNHLSSTVSDSSYLIKEKGLYKVQAGNFVKRIRADSLKAYLKAHGFPGAWVAQRMILIPFENQQAKTAQPQPSEVNAEFPFKIQVFATADKAKAKALVSRLKSEFHYPCNFQKDKNLFKIYLTGFNTRQEAEIALQKIKKSGYKDAWIVHK